MGLLEWIKGLFGAGTPPTDEGAALPPPEAGMGLEELARRLDVGVEQLRSVQPGYRRFTIPKRSGGTRTIDAPDPPLKALQRQALRRVLGRLRSHPAAAGFERGRSIVTNALPHRSKAVIVRMDLRDFFAATSADRVQAYFRRIGWNAEAAGALTRLCTWQGRLPQGAPTSPRLSNLVNCRLDARLSALAERFAAAYTRYADDLTFSFARDDPRAVREVIGMTKHIVGDCGYRLHQDKKLRISRRHARQVVTGLVVNDGVDLPRSVRRRLRAVEHRLANGRQATLTPQQLAGWKALRSMIAAQALPPTA